MRSASQHGGSAASAASHGFTVTVYSDDLERGHVSPAPKGWVTSLADILADLHSQAVAELKRAQPDGHGRPVTPS
jgi:hypothetical protein